ncbi:hypothetical protein OAF74_03145 [bacterium]|nr:hypothetical protein [bacterium]MDB4731813.1 hypothetical protein [bacterium]
MAGLHADERSIHRFAPDAPPREYFQFTFDLRNFKMADSRFWRTLALLFVIGVFYLAHGLHDPATTETFPSLTKELNAEDVILISKPNNANVKIVTASDDGRTINVWSTTTGLGGANFVGSYTAKKN